MRVIRQVVGHEINLEIEDVLIKTKQKQSLRWRCDGSDCKAEYTELKGPGFNPLLRQEK